MKYLCSLLGMLLPFLMTGQYLESGILTGVSMYKGDLDRRNNPFSFGPPHLALSVFGRYHMDPYTAIRLSLTYGKVSADDRNGATPYQKRRNLSFRSDIFELSLMGELHVFGFYPKDHTKRFSPYICGGVGIFHFNPQAQFQGKWVDLQPLGTEGQGLSLYPDRKPYPLTSVSFPWGFGLRIALNHHINIGLEATMHYTLTDYIDDVSKTYPDYDLLLSERGSLSSMLSDRTWEFTKSAPGAVRNSGRTRGNSVSRDWFLVSGITITYSFLDMYESFHQRPNRNCPRF